MKYSSIKTDLENKVVVRKESCPRCKSLGKDHSNDNKIVYSDGGWWCFSCNRGKVDPNEDEEQIFESEDDVEFGQAEWSKIRKECALSKESKDAHEGFLFRGISDETYKIFGVLNKAGLDDNSVIEQYYPLTTDIDGQTQICGTKVRGIPKKFWAKGSNRASTTHLFGQFIANKSGKKTVVIASGECFPSTTKVLTERGFVPFSDLKDTEKVMSVDPKTGEGTLVYPTAIINKPYNGDLTQFADSNGFSLTCTPEHNLAYSSKSKGFDLYKRPASYKPDLSHHMKGSISYNNEDILGVSDDEIDLISLLVFRMYDSFNFARNNVLVIKTSNTTQREFVLDVVRRLDIKNFIEESYNIHDEKHVVISMIMPTYLRAFIGIDYDHSYIYPSQEWLLKCTDEQRRRLLRNLQILSGKEDTIKLTKYQRTYSRALDFYTLLATLTGHKVSFGGTSKSIYYTATYSESSNISIRRLWDRKRSVSYEGTVHCVEVDSGYIVVLDENSEFPVVVGNCDAMATFQMLKSLGAEAPAVVSSTTGEKSVNQFKAQYDFFNKFEKIVIIPDNDKAGKEALDEIVLSLPRDKVFVVELPTKDSNDMLMQGLESEFIVRYRRAKPYVPNGVVGSSQLYDKVLANCNQQNVPIPDFMRGLNELFPTGFALESIMNLVAASGIGAVSP